ncbi:MAG: hypothetical protein A2504_02325 [Bdellovibrionales bacterium RIFOXYD12_FULL_39_22]|nr:MAG: hypothetical protein A2385_12350 [Bdellovibrionales bacterium RIFOXYB1_FULL_39_21]OFZ41431.1 MAG: hypothetical protein A2485_01520 [Bdellovibrionales bacterium RIFOXYC12_FULL_39_17]OFZ45387.1 MAG: hypothetical protein A2404_13535 [Bdellovibrionales bacterium RIFOXYC1_FULL_39_130]OFZ71234.1 MAG: hypothetical protein A2451_14030 [Bdellovibrionales bacterium RIFOXYC2_FULL_39_8]OFZ74583.1 MAG: hypothetical protein A2560_12640 [Bdellovibrionales bacterium RIFOXYD1_FULL_39_84]OFZ92591.1 MAG:
MTFLIALASSFWLGVLTSISPCPLATNIAAISYVSRKSHRLMFVFTTGVCYALGRILAYSILSVLIVESLLSIPSVSFFFQKYMHLLLGPLLIIVGMFLLELISIPIPSIFKTSSLENRFKEGGFWGAMGLGFLFALAFCPVSAALYFGSLIPLAVGHRSPIIISLIFGIGTALPVLLFSIALALGSKVAAKLFTRVTVIEKWISVITGATILLVGTYFCLTYIFKLI